MDRFRAGGFTSSVSSGCCRCADGVPEPVDTVAEPVGVRVDLVRRCRALIDGGLYETDDRVDAAVARLA